MLQRLIPIQPEKRTSFIDHWLAGRSLPLIEKDHVYFIYKNKHEIPVFLAGDMNGWKTNKTPFLKIIGSEYNYCRQQFATDARVEYKFIVNGRWLLDSLNTRKAIGGLGENSLLLMPDYKFPPETLLGRQYKFTQIDTSDFTVRKGSLKYKSYFYKNILADSTSPLLVFNDGADYLKFGMAGIILDNLIRLKKIPPCQALFLQPYKRMKEYWLNEKFIRMLTGRYLPWAMQKYKISPSAPVFMGGASLGGVTAFYASKFIKLSGVFAQSGSFWIDDTKIVDILNPVNLSGTKFYFDFGTFERQDSARNAMVRLLDSKGVSYQENSWPEGHNWGNWRGHLTVALRYLLNPVDMHKSIK